MKDKLNLNHRLGEDNSVSAWGLVQLRYKSIEAYLVRLISRADMVVGCVAWVTNAAILQALGNLHYGSSLVVNKESYLVSPEYNARKWEKYQRGYSGLSVIPHHDIDGLHFEQLEAIMLTGGWNSGERYYPRMHHKFIVLCKVVQSESGQGLFALPQIAVTGSYNFSETANRSHENIVVIESGAIAQSYYNEWRQIATISDPYVITQA